MSGYLAVVRSARPILAASERQSMKPASSIRDLIVEAAQRDAQASALIATDGVTFTYGALVDRIDGMVADLRARGVGATERIALVLPNGISAALAFLAGASASIACPLNPASRRADLDFAFDDLQTTTLVTDWERAGHRQPRVPQHQRPRRSFSTHRGRPRSPRWCR
jgi:acyl-CoA synthetase (AMP-forming)/AMP-acid ligase II